MSGRQKVNILLVDDQPAKLLTYETILAELGENLIRAGSATDALQALLHQPIAVVLVDVCMPDIDGFQLATMIRNHPRFRKTAIILVSGVLVEDVDRLKGYHSGAVDYVSVPIVPEILRAKVAVFAELYRKTQELENLNRELEQRVAERTHEIEQAAARLRASDERLRLVLSSSRISVWTLPVPEAPAGAAGEGAVTREEFLSSVHPEDRTLVEAALDAALSGAAGFAAEFRLVEAGRERWMLGRGTVLRDPSGRPLSIAGMSMDITGRKRSEQERARLLVEAQQARQEAEEANRLKDEFLATLSHELRTPLHAITGWAHLLRLGALDPAQHERAIETISRNAELQNQLISDILDVSRIITGKLRLETRSLQLRTVVEAALDTVRPAADAKRIVILAELGGESASVLGDAARLQQVVWNVLANAIKFTPVGGHVEVELAERGARLEITVRDDGPGIPTAFLPFIFDRFRQADSSSTRPHQGLGLGMAIVRHLVEMHGGTVAASNRRDRSGAVVTISLPPEPRTAAAAGAVAAGAEEDWLAGAAALRGARVLVVDDEADGREAVAAVLARCGVQTLVAASASEALGLIRSASPGIVLADIEMPGEDGYSLLRSVRALPADEGGGVRIAALTAYASPQDRERVLKAGFELHVAKPIRPAELVAALASLCGTPGPPQPSAAAAGRPAS